MAASFEVTDATEDFGDRVWVAYLALERGEHGALPAETAIEDQNDISRGTLGKIFSGQRQWVQPKTTEKIARALKTSVEFLAHGTGKRPVPKQPIFPRPRRFDVDGNPISLPGVYEGVAQDFLGVHDLAALSPSDVVYLRASEGRALNELPEEVRRAVMGAVHLLGCPLESAVTAAQRAMGAHQGVRLTPKMWLAAIETELSTLPAPPSR